MTPAEKQAFDAMREALEKFTEYEKAMDERDDVCGMLLYAEFSDMSKVALAAADAVAEQGQAKPLGWYCVSSDGMATLCADEEDARQVAKESNLLWTIHGTHKAIQLCEYRDNTKQ